MEIPAWGIIATILVGVLVLAITKSWELGFHPFRVDIRLKALEDAVNRVSNMRVLVLIEHNPHQSFYHGSRWLESVLDLEGKFEEIKGEYNRCRGNLFGLCYLGMRVAEKLARAKELSAQEGLVKDLLSKTPVIRSLRKYPQDPSQEMMNSRKDKVLDFISEHGAMYGLLGIWGLSVKGNSCLLSEVRDSRSQFDGGDPSVVVLQVTAGKGCTVAQLQDAIAMAMVPEIPPLQIHDRLKDKSFVLLLDDLWDSIDLQAVGIPELQPREGEVQRHRRKVVFTTSTIGVCARMRCHKDKIIELECFTEVVNFPGMMASYMKVLDFIKSNNKHGKMMIWGMGGVGKSTLLDLVYSYRPVFDGDTSLVVLYVQAGKECTVAKVQKAIVDARKLKEVPDKTSQSSIIFDHLKDKSFLLLLDDMWVSLDLEAVGIPNIEHSSQFLVQPQHWRKVVFTTRNSTVRCHTKTPGINSELHMKRLSEEDAWKLFNRKVGEVINNHQPRIRELARQIVQECGGLPDALNKIGQDMSTKKDCSQWETALDDLKLPKLHEDIASRLKLSYTDIKGDMRECFSTCSLWTENENIPKEELIRWWIGLGFIPASKEFRGNSIIQDLLGLSMLEKGDTGPTENSHVKMHNMMGKMFLDMNQGMWLPHSSHRSALQKEEWYRVEKAWISERDTTSSWWEKEDKVSVTSSLESPHNNTTQTSSFQLTMLVARHVFSIEQITRFKLITFLDLEGMRSPIPFAAICKLDKLHHLNLSATTITALPLDLEKLPNLRYLYIRHNNYLEIIAEGLIQKLEKLQALDLYYTSGISNCSSLVGELSGYAKDLRMLGFTVQKIVDIKKLEGLNRETTLALCMDHFDVESPSEIINLELLSSLNNLRELAIRESSGSTIGLQSGIQNDDNRNDIQSGSHNELVAESVVGGGHQCPNDIQRGMPNDIQNDDSQNDIQYVAEMLVEVGDQCPKGIQNDIKDDVNQNDIQNASELVVEGEDQCPNGIQSGIQSGIQNDNQDDVNQSDIQNVAQLVVEGGDQFPSVIQSGIQNDIQDDVSQNDIQNEFAVRGGEQCPNGIQNDIQKDDSQNDIEIGSQNDGDQCPNRIRSVIQNEDSENDIQHANQNKLVVELVVRGGDQSLFPDLNIFKLDNLRKLKKVTWVNAGRNIKVVDIHGCEYLKDVTWVHQLQLLEQLTIARCGIMEKLIDSATMETEISFPQLKRLCLEELPQLSLISTKACDVNGLSYVQVDQCLKLKNIENLRSHSENMIRIDCNKVWWESLSIRPPYFNPTFDI